MDNVTRVKMAGVAAVNGVAAAAALADSGGQRKMIV
jgi:hypothetical protein